MLQELFMGAKVCLCCVCKVAGYSVVRALGVGKRSVRARRMVLDLFTNETLKVTPSSLDNAVEHQGTRKCYALNVQRSPRKYGKVKGIHALEEWDLQMSTLRTKVASAFPSAARSATSQIRASPCKPPDSIFGALKLCC